MSSRESAHCQWRRYGDRGTRQWDDPDNRWKERRRHDSDVSRDSCYGYGGEAHTSMKRTRGNWEYNDLPESSYSKDPLNRDRRRSPARRSSTPRITPDKDIDLESEYVKLRNEDLELLRKKRELQVIEDQITHKKAALAMKQFSTKQSVFKGKLRRFTEGDDEDLEFRQSPDEFTHRQPPNDFYRQRPEEFKQRQPPEEDFKYRKTPTNRKHRQQPEDFTYRQPLEYHKDEPFKGRSNDNLLDRTQSEEFPSRVQTKPRENNDRHYLDYDYEDHHQNRMKCPMSEAARQSNGQGFEAEQDVTNQGAGLSWGTDEQNTAEKGFQRFLSVLNKGVDISKLTKIVCQARGKDQVPPHSQTSLQNTVDPPWSHSGARQGESQTNTPYSGESQRTLGEASGQDHIDFTSEERTTELPCQKGSHIGFQGHTLSYEKSLPRIDAGGSHLSSSSKMRSPLDVEKSQVKPEDEQMSRQMQDVLQAIGMDLELKELGLMSNRIQERLYGRRDSEKRESDKDREKETRRVYSPRRHSRSSSSGNSSFGHLTQQFSLKKDLREAPRDITDVNQTIKHGYTGDKSSSISVQDTDGNKSQQSTVAPHSFSHNPTYPTYPIYPMPPPQAAPLMPPTYPTYPTYPMPQPQAATYPAGQYSPYTCSTVNTAVPPPWGINFGAIPYLPCPPVYPPPPSVPTLNTYPSASSQRNTYLEHSSSRQLTYVNLLYQNPVQPVNTTQTSPTLSRPRCLQVIDTRRPQQTKTTTEEIESKSVKNTVVLKKTLSEGVELMPPLIKTNSGDAFITVDN